MNEGAARRMVRSNSLSHAPVSFIQCKNLPGDPFSIADISESGARIVIPPRFRSGETAASLAVGKVLEGWCLVGGCHSAPLRFRMVHLLANHEAGVEFLDPSEHLKSLIRNYFEPELVGSTLWVDEEVAGAVQRFSNHRTCEVELRMRDGRIDEIHVCVRQNGEIRDWAVDPEQALPMLRLLSNIQKLDPGIKREIEERLTQPAAKTFG